MKPRASNGSPLPFRVYLSDGQKIEITTGSPQAASAAVTKRLREAGSEAFVTKVKLIREARAN